MEDITIKYHNDDFFILTALKKKIKFVGNYAVVKAIAISKEDSKEFFVMGVVNRNYEEAFTIPNGWMSDALRFRKQNKEILIVGEKDFIIKDVDEIRTGPPAHPCEYRHLRDKDGKIELINYDIGGPLRPTIIDNIWICKSYKGSYLYDMKKGMNIMGTEHHIINDFTKQTLQDSREIIVAEVVDFISTDSKQHNGIKTELVSYIYKDGSFITPVLSTYDGKLYYLPEYKDYKQLQEQVISDLLNKEKGIDKVRKQLINKSNVF